MKKILNSKIKYFGLGLMGAILLIAGVAHADISTSYWIQNSPNVLMTNTSGGFATADIHVAHCYIGTGTSTPCGSGGGGGSPGGTDGSIQYNEGGGFQGDANLTWNPSSFIFDVGDQTLAANGTIFEVNDASQTVTSTGVSGIGYSPVTGTINKLEYSQTYDNSATLPITYTVTVAGIGSPNTFTWSDSEGGSGGPGLMSSSVSVSHGINLEFAQLTGNTIGQTSNFTISRNLGGTMFSFDGNVGLYQIGDINDYANRNTFVVNDQRNVTQLNTPEFYASDPSSGNNYFDANYNAGFPTFVVGDNYGGGNGTKISLDDSTQLIKLDTNAGVGISVDGVTPSIGMGTGIGNPTLNLTGGGSNSIVGDNGTDSGFDFTTTGAQLGDINNRGNSTKFFIDDSDQEIETRAHDFKAQDTSGNSWLDTDTVNGITTIGDIGGVQNQNKFIVDDLDNQISARMNSIASFNIQDNAGHTWLNADLQHNKVNIGDISGIADSIWFTVDSGNDYVGPHLGGAGATFDVFDGNGTGNIVFQVAYGGVTEISGNWDLPTAAPTAGQVLGSTSPGFATWVTPFTATPAALTKTNDTNVTLTLGGTPSTALLQATSLTLGWTGTLGVARGGTNLASYTAGDTVYASGSTTLSKLAIGSPNQVYTVSAGNLPSWVAAQFVAPTHYIFTPSTGNTVAMSDNGYNIINPSGALLALTLTFPSSPANNDVVEIKFTNTVSTVTYPGTVIGGIASPILGSYEVFHYDTSATKWY